MGILKKILVAFDVPERIIKVLLLFCLLPATLILTGKEAYRIEIRIDGIHDSVCYLANYYGDKTYLTDTAYRQPDGTFVFTGEESLPGGIYILAGQENNKYFEFIVDEEQNFIIEASVPEIPGSMKFTNSTDNSVFYSYINNNLDVRKQIEILKTKAAADPDSAKMLNSKIEMLYDSLQRFENALVNQNIGSFVSVLLKARQDPELPAMRHQEDGRLDSIYRYQMYKKHYWDNLDPSDDRLLRTPLYHNRLKTYFEKIILQNPDTLIREADEFIDRVQDNPETFKYVVWYLTFTYETSNIMGFDEIFVHMVDAYYARGLAYWADSSVVTGLKTRADELRPVLIGNQAPDLILLDTAGSFISLYSIQAPYVLVLFYEYDCNHCRNEIKELKKWYPDNPYNLEIFAVCTDTSLVQWKKFIQEKQLPWVHANATRSVTPDYHILYNISVTPTIYLLDDQKKIIAKRLKTEQLIPFMENLTKQERSSAGQNPRMIPERTTN